MPGNTYTEIEKKNAILWLFTHLDNNGRPKVAEGQRQLKISSSALSTWFRAEIDKPEPDRLVSVTEINETKRILWDNIKGGWIERYRVMIPLLLQRVHDTVLDDTSDARDIRHLIQGLSDAVKVTALLSGDVTSRTQQSIDSTARTETIHRFELPVKTEAAFEVIEGVRAIDTGGTAFEVVEPDQAEE